MTEENNALHPSDGVKTDEGKKISRMNAMKHGLTCDDISGLDKEMVNFDELLKRISEEMQPQGILESLMVEKIAINYLRSLRAIKIEKNLINSELYPPSTKKIYKDPEAAKQYEEEYKNYLKKMVQWEASPSRFELLSCKIIEKPTPPTEPDFEIANIRGEKPIFLSNALERLTDTINRYYITTENRFYRAIRELNDYRKENGITYHEENDKK